MVQKYIGIDLSIKGKHTAVILADNGQKEKIFSFLTDRKDLEMLVSTAKSGISQKVTLNFIMEPTSTVWIPIAYYLSAKGHRIFIIKPEKAHDLRKFLKKHSKTDKIDAHTLAKMPIIDKDGLYPFIPSNEDYFTLNRLCRNRFKLADLSSAIQCKIRNILYIAVPGLEKVFPHLFKAIGRKFLRNYINPHKVKSLGLKRFTNVLKKAAKGNFQPQEAIEIYNACLKAADLYSSFLPPFNYHQLQQEVNFLLDELELMEKQMAELDKEINTRYLKLDPNQILHDFMGIGPVIAPALLGVIGNILRFSNLRKFVSFCGWAPKKKQSSSRNKEGLRISKAAQNYLKRILYIAAETARQWDPQAAALYHKLINKGKHHKQAVCAVAAFMSRRIYSVAKRVQKANALNSKLPDALINPLRYQLRDFNGNKIEPKDARILIAQKFPNKKRNSAKLSKSYNIKGKNKQLNRDSAKHFNKDDSILPLSVILSQVKNNLLDNVTILPD